MALATRRPRAGARRSRSPRSNRSPGCRPLQAVASIAVPGGALQYESNVVLPTPRPRPGATRCRSRSALRVPAGRRSPARRWRWRRSLLQAHHIRRAGPAARIDRRALPASTVRLGGQVDRERQRRREGRQIGRIQRGRRRPGSEVAAIPAQRQRHRSRAGVDSAPSGLVSLAWLDRGQAVEHAYHRWAATGDPASRWRRARTRRTAGCLRRESTLQARVGRPTAAAGADGQYVRGHRTVATTPTARLPCQLSPSATCRRPAWWERRTWRGRADWSCAGIRTCPIEYVPAPRRGRGPGRERASTAPRPSRAAGGVGVGA